MEVTFYGHSCFLINIRDTNILFDPFISGNELAKGIEINSIKADYVLLSHGHQDHILDALTIAKNNNATLVSNFEIINWYAKQGYEKGQALNQGGSWKFDFGKVKYVNAIHTSGLPDGSYGGNPGGFIVTVGETEIYFAGDTALTLDMELIGLYNLVDLAFLPIGDCFTMGVDDAVIASDYIKCDQIVGMHYDTFPPIKIDKAEAIAKFDDAGKELILFEIGETKTF